MSEHEKKDPRVGRRDTLKLASAVSALGIGLGASLAPRDASAESGTGIHGLKYEALKIDGLVLSIHKGDASAPPVHAVDITPLVTQAGKLAPGTYFLKLTAYKERSVVSTNLDAITIK